MAEIVVALDVPDRARALRLVDRLPALRWVKVGSLLMAARDGGPVLVHELAERGLLVFLDLKWHDIPSTVAGAAAAARELGVRMATVHTLGGSAMMHAASETAGSQLALVGVTVLTSHQEADYAEITGRPSVRLLDEAARLAQSAMSSGLSGVVCSPLEIERIRQRVGPHALIVVPGIRRPGDSAGDQRRTADPAEAVRLGATHLVVGRPILEAPDPGSAFEGFRQAAEAEGTTRRT